MSKRRLFSVVIPALLLFAVTGCQTASAPQRRELLGSWVSDDLAGVVVRMTVSETARSVDGAGSWTEAQTSGAFRVSGALARDEVALYFEFDDRPDLSFQGFFRDEDTIMGTLAGGSYRQAAMTFDREDLLID